MPPISLHQTPCSISIETTPSTVTNVCQQQTPVIIDDKQWFYKDPQNTIQGPFSSADMERWYAAGYFTVLLPVKRLGETEFTTIQQLIKELGYLPFRTDVPFTSTQKQQQQQQQSINIHELQKFNPMIYTTPLTGNHAFIDDCLMQQAPSRQNITHSLMFNR